MVNVCVRVGMVAVGGTLCFLMSPAVPASAHAQLVTTAPAAGAHLARAPGEVVLRFTEPVTPVRDSIRLLDSAGRDVLRTQPRTPSGQPDEVRFPVPEGLADGGYLVSWRVVSADSHAVAGSFGFSVGAGGVPAPAPPSAPGDTAFALTFWAARSLGYVALVLFGGGLLFMLLCWPAGLARTGPRRLVGAAWVAGLAATAAGLLLQGLDVSGRSWPHALDVDVVGATMRSEFGQLGLVRLGLFATGAALVRYLVGPNRRPGPGAPGRGASVAAVVVVAGLCLTWSATGHARAGTAVALGMAADTAHLLAMAVWLAGLVFIFVGVLAADGDRPVAEAMAVVSRFSRVAMAAVAVLVVTGTAQAWRMLGVNPLSGGAYTQLLVFKLAAFGLLLCLAAASRAALRRRYSDARAEPAATRAGVVARASVATMARNTTTASRTRPSAARRQRELAAIRLLRRSVLVELAIGAAVLGLTAALVSTSPSAHDGAQPPGGPYRGPFTTVLTLSGGIQVHIWIDPAAAGQNQLVAGVRDANGAARDVPEVRAALSRPALGVQRLPIALTREGPGQFVARDVQLPVPGSWRLELWVRTSEVDEVSGATDVPFG